MNDLISRQAAIDALERDIKFVEEEREKAITRPEKYHDRFVEASTQQIMGMAHALQAIEELPSAQPERLTDYSFEESCTECPAYDTENHRCPRFNQVIRTALKDANLEPCEDCISRQAAIDTLDVGTELLRRVLDNADVVGVERAKYEWGLGLIESYIADVNDLPSAQPEQPPYVAEIEAEYQKAVKMPHIHKPLAKALYEVWKKHDREDAERRTDE